MLRSTGKLSQLSSTLKTSENFCLVSAIWSHLSDKVTSDSGVGAGGGTGGGSDVRVSGIVLKSVVAVEHSSLWLLLERAPLIASPMSKAKAIATLLWEL